MKLKNQLTTYFLLLSVCIINAQNITFTTNLPIVFLNTNDQVIPDDPRIVAEMGIIWNENGENGSTDSINHFNGKITIETRGSTSQRLPKKSFGLELKDEFGEDMDFPLLGMPEEEDWILYAPYSDKTLIRNVLTFALASQFSKVYAPRCRFVELFINNKYEGIYVLMEKIKRDSTRVDIAKLKPDDLSGEELTGGYIVKIDKTTGSGGQGWYSQYMNKNSTRTRYQYHYPDDEDIQPQQKEYIQNYFNEFEKAVYERNFHPEWGYTSYINSESFFDFLYMNEISKNVDGYRLSSYLYKEKNGKIHAGPLWDFNRAYGNAKYYDGWNTGGLQINEDLKNDKNQIPFWWSILLTDPFFSHSLRCRWDSLREHQLSFQYINFVADSLVNHISGALERNYERWPVMGEYVPPNYFIGANYEEEVDWMMNWIDLRLKNLDGVIPGDCNAPPVYIPQFDSNEIAVYPTLFTSKFTIQFNLAEGLNYRFMLYSVSGKLIMNRSISVSEGVNRIEINGIGLSSGVYIYHMDDGNTHEVGKVIKK